MLRQRFRRHGTGRVGRHSHELLCQRGQQLQHLVHILVGHDADQEHELLTGEAVLQALHRGPHAVGVVAAVQQEGRVMPQQLKAARPLHGLQSGADGTFRHIPAFGPQHPQGGDGHRRVAGLVAADEGQVHPVQPIKIKGDCVQISTVDLQVVEIHFGQGRVLLCCHPPDDRIGLRDPAVAHHRAARLDDARLGGGNIGQRGAQLPDVVHTQRGDHGALRILDDVGGIQRAAQPHFQHHDVALFAGKIQHPQRGDDLEFGGHIRHGVGGRLHPLHQLHQFFVRDLLPVHLNPLVEPVDEGRGEQAHPVPGCLQAGRQHGRRAALAVGARHMDEPELFVRVAQSGQQGAGAAQAGFVPGPLHRVDVFHCLFVVHSSCLDSRS